MDSKDDSGVLVQTSKHDEAEISADSCTNPLVFQCAQCAAIVGDSVSWVSADNTMRLVTLSSVSGKVGLKKEVELSSSGADEGSTFQRLFCIQCNEVLGKLYIASKPHFDYIRGCYSLQVEKLNSYQVGSTMNARTSDLSDLVTVPSPQYMMEKISKMHYLLVSMNERITKLERQTGGNNVSMDHGDAESVTSSELLPANVQPSSSASVPQTNGLRRNVGVPEYMVEGQQVTDDFERPEGQVARKQHMLVANEQRGKQIEQGESQRVNAAQDSVLRRYPGNGEGVQQVFQKRHNNTDNMLPLQDAKVYLRERKQENQLNRRNRELASYSGEETADDFELTRENMHRWTVQPYQTNMRRSRSRDLSSDVTNTPGGNEGFKSPDQNTSHGSSRNMLHSMSEMESRGSGRKKRKILDNA